MTDRAMTDRAAEERQAADGAAARESRGRGPEAEAARDRPATIRDALIAEPWRFDILGLLRLIERSHPDRPRIGDARSWADEYVGLGENPFLEFPAQTIEQAVAREGGRLDLYVRFLGLLGPHGPMPLHMTDEVYGWSLAGHEAFPRFLDILNHRFLQLFFRAWADARPIAQADRPAEDRFVAYIGGQIGLGSPALQGRDTVPDTRKLAFAGLLAPKARSASRLAQAVEGLFGIRCEVDEFVGGFLAFERSDQSRLGRAHSRLGADCLVGSSVYSVEDKIRLRLYATSLAQYESFLPQGSHITPLADLLFFILGHEIDCEAELVLPEREIPPLRLTRGTAPRLGYTSWMIKAPEGSDGSRRDARLNPAARARRAAATP